MKTYLYYGISKELLAHMTENLLRDFGLRVHITSEKVGNGDFTVTVHIDPPPKREPLVFV